MSKISIVGVEGSGKTVLLSAIGDKYETPDASGIFMSPENARAFGFVKLHMEAMKNGQWPAATTTNSNLDWSIYHRTEQGKELVCQLSLLDFAGELYRLSFGEHTEEEIGTWGEEMAVLKDHIAESDLLIVIVNLSDIINGTPSNPRTRETMWLSKSVIDYATRNGKNKEVAIVLSQSDIYRNEIDACGGTQGVLKKYLPHVANLYDNLPCFSVSAINKTTPDENGMAVPAQGFESEGLDELMEWIISKTPGFENVAQLMIDNRLNPSRFKDQVNDLYARYFKSLDLNTFERCAIAEELADTIQRLHEANLKSPKTACQLDENIEREAQEILQFEVAAREIMQSVTAQECTTALAKLENSAKTLDKIAAQKERLTSEIEYFHNKMKNDHIKAVKKKLFIALSAIIVLIILAFVGDFAYKMHKQKLHEKHLQMLAEQYEANLRQKERDGYQIVEQDGKRVAVWVPNCKHPSNDLLTSAETDGVWICSKPGYAWTSGSNIAWKAGLIHPNNSKLTSSTEVDKWVANAEGYVWAGEDKTEWKSGIPSKKYPHWISSDTEGKWILEEGYKKKDTKSKYISEAIWNPGYITRDGKRMAGQTEGTWLEKTNCTSCKASGSISSTTDCWNCDGSGNVYVSEDCSRCNGSKKITSYKSCSVCEGDGELLTECNGTYYGAKCGMITNSATGAVSTYHGYVCNPCNGYGYIGYFKCTTCNGYGWLYCQVCNETGYIKTSCSYCNGKGTWVETDTCYSCDSYGKVKVKKTCSYCSYGKNTSTNKCYTCDGKGYVYK